MSEKNEIIDKSAQGGVETNAPKVSVIVPVYKVEKYLPECIDSILAQTFTNFELILVDDGSPDNSGKICDDYAARDPHICVFHKENGGVTSARSLGVENAKGEWVMFVDGDDKIFPYALDVLFRTAESEDEIDICEGEPLGVDKVLLRGALKGKIHYAEQGGYLLEIGMPFNTAPWGKIIRRKCFGKGEFDIPQWINKGEDHLMLVRIALSVRRAAKVSVPVYFYRKNEESVGHRVVGTADYSLRYFTFLKGWLDLSNPRQYEGFGVFSQRIFVGMFLFSKDWRQSAVLCAVADEINRGNFRCSFGYRVCDFSNRLPSPVREFAWIALQVRMRWKQFLFRRK